MIYMLIKEKFAPYLEKIGACCDFFSISGKLYFYKKYVFKTDLLEPKLFFLPKNSLARQCNKNIYMQAIFS